VADLSRPGPCWDTAAVTAPVVETRRLRVRPLADADRDRLLRYRNDPETARLRGWSQPFSLDRVDGFIAANTASRPGVAGGWYQFAVADRSTDELVGDVGLYTAAPGHSPGGRIGFTIDPDFRGRGYAIEAARAVRDFAFDSLGFPSLGADALAENLASLRVLHRLGFIATGDARAVEADDAATGFEIDYVCHPADRVRVEPLVGLLTGGKSTRMGSDKATTMVAGRSMAERVRDSIAETGFDAVVLGPNDAGTGLPSIGDLPNLPAGPLGGLLSLCAAHPGHDVLLVATDQPLVMPTTLLQLAMQPAADAAVPFDEGHPQVTLARWGGDVPALVAQHEIVRLRDVIDVGDSRIIDEATWRTWGEDGRSFRSLDRPEDIAQAVRDFPDAS